METSRYKKLVIQECDGNHVRKGDRHSKMTMSADSGRSRQPSWSGDSLYARYCNNVPSLQNSVGTIRTSRVEMPLIWQRRISLGTLRFLLVLVTSLWVVPTSAVLVDFQNCLSESYQNDTPQQLQFDPLYVNAVFNTTDSSHNLNITVWGNVTGSGPGNGKEVLLPPANNTDYWNSNQTILGGKIENIPDPPPGVNKYTTLFNKVNVLMYEPWSNTVNFCDQLINASCPLGPAFDANA